MPELSKRLAAVVITQTYAKLWTSGLQPGAESKKIVTPEPHERHTPGRVGLATIVQQGHDAEYPNPTFYEEIAKELTKAPQILLLGHGKGKANTMDKFVHYLEGAHPQLAKKVIGKLDVNLQALTDPEILAMSRNWYTKHIESGI